MTFMYLWSQRMHSMLYYDLTRSSLSAGDLKWDKADN